jgi:hypothetical protein
MVSRRHGKSSRGLSRPLVKRRVAGVIKEFTEAPKEASNKFCAPRVEDYDEADLRAALARVLRLEDDIALLLRQQENGRHQWRGAGVQQPWREYDMGPVRTGIPKQADEMGSLLTSLIEDCTFCTNTRSGVPEDRWTAVERNDTFTLNKSEDVDEEERPQEDPEPAHHTVVPKQADEILPSLMKSLVDDCTFCSSTGSGVPDVRWSALDRNDADLTRNKTNVLEDDDEEEGQQKDPDPAQHTVVLDVDEEEGQQEDPEPVQHTAVPKQVDEMVPSFLTSFTEDCSFCNNLKSGVPESPWVVEDLNDVDKEDVDEEEATCCEEDAIEWNWDFADRHADPQKGGRSLRIMERLALERQNHKVSKKQQSSEKLQKRLEKIYNREQKIRALDKQLGIFTKKSNRKTVRDDISYAVSMAHKSVITSIGLEVAQFEL